MLRAAVEPARSDSLAGGWRPDRARLLAALLNDCDGGQAIPVSPLVLPNSGLEKKQTNKKVFFFFKDVAFEKEKNRAFPMGSRAEECGGGGIVFFFLGGGFRSVTGRVVKENDIR